MACTYIFKKLLFVSFFYIILFHLLAYISSFNVFIYASLFICFQHCVIFIYWILVLNFSLNPVYIYFFGHFCMIILFHFFYFICISLCVYTKLWINQKLKLSQNLSFCLLYNLFFTLTLGAFYDNFDFKFKTIYITIWRKKYFYY